MNSRILISVAMASALLGGAASPLVAAAEPMQPVFRTGRLPQDASNTPPRMYGNVQNTDTSATGRPAVYHGGLMREQATTTRPVNARGSFPQIYNGTTTRPARFTASNTPERTRLIFGAQMADRQQRVQALINQRSEILQRFMLRMENGNAASTSGLRIALEQHLTNLNRFRDMMASSSDASSTLTSVTQAMTNSYRGFAVVMGASAVTAAAERTQNIVSQMQELSAKLSARLASSTNPTAAAALADFNTKVASASSLAKAALAAVSGISTSTNTSDASQFQADEAALKDARTKLQEAEQALVAARKDAGTIVRALLQTSVTASATTTASTTQ